MTMRGYILFVFLCGATALAALFAATLIMDPLYYYGSVDRRGLNAVRYGAVDYPETAKVYSVEWYGPRTVILGSSRAQIGLDPAYKGFAHQPVYSLAYPGSSMRRTLALFEHAVATNELRQVVLAVDFFMFRAATHSDAEFVRLAVLPDGTKPDRLKHWRARASDLWRVSFSSAAIKLAADDLLRNSRTYDLRYMRWVMRRDGHNELMHGHSFDYAAMFGSVEAKYAKDYLSGDFCLSSRVGESSLGDLGVLIRRARDLGIDLRIVISPAHASLAEVIDRTGLWQAWESWKREIVRLADAAADPAGKTPVFDFSGYNAVTTEAVPIGSVDLQMNNYWDPSHYKRHIGDRMLGIALGRNDPSDPTFGRQLTLANIDHHLASIRVARSAWQADNPEQVDRIRVTSPEKLPERTCPRWAE